MGRVFANGPGDRGSISGRVIPKTLKIVLDTSCLTLSNMRYVSRVKWSNSGKGVAPSPTPWCSSYWKGSLLVALNYGCQLKKKFYLIIIIICLHTVIWLREGTSLKLVDKFTYQGSSVSSTEKDIDTRLTKAAIDKISIIWKSDLTWQAAVISILLYGCTTWTLTKRLEKKRDGNYIRMLRATLNMDSYR